MDEAIIGSKQCIAVNISKKANSRRIGAAVLKRVNRSSMEDEVSFNLQLFEFFEDNDHFSSLDSLLVQFGSSVLYLPEELEQAGKGDGRKVSNILFGKDVEVVYCKKSAYSRPSGAAGGTTPHLLRLSHPSSEPIANLAESEVPLAYTCVECLVNSLRLLELEEVFGKVVVQISSLGTYMRLDSAAAEAVNLLPKADHPSQFGSIFGVLNRCKSKMGTRLLERYILGNLLST